MKQHVQPLLSVVHAQLIKRGAVAGSGQFPVLEPRRIQNVDTGTGLCAARPLQGPVDEHDESRHGLLVETHDKRIERRRTVAALRRDDRRAVGVDGPRVREVEVGGLGGGGEEGGETEGGASRRVEDVLPEVLVVDAEDDGGSLGGSRVEETFTASH